MFSNELTAVIWGIASAITWGTGDFFGGYASKRINSFLVLFLSQLVGGILLAVLALLFSEPFPIMRDLLLGAVAGISGGLGLLVFYSSLASGRMGIVAPTTAIVSALLPVFVGAFLDGLPVFTQILGIILALVAVWLLAASGDSRVGSLRELLAPALAGALFAGFFINMDLITPGSVFWPLVAARVTSVTLMVIIIISHSRWEKTGPSDWRNVSLAGIFDAGGNAFFALATQAGRLDIASVLASFYPASTVFLAWLILSERLSRLQWAGVGCALLAMTLIAL